MGLLESIFYMLWRGIAIGIIISAPMGPVGILCIQRTLDKGRRTGLFTGVGAALSDLFYCILTGFGLSFIEEFLERNQEVIQLLGSIVLIGFSVYLFRKNPAKNLKKPTGPPKESRGMAVLGGFLFTISNPLILFLIIGLFARFNFLVPEIRFYHYIIGFAAIFLGALTWWWLVTFFVDKVRAHFNLRSMWLINHIIGVIILLFAVVGIITSILDLSAPARAQSVLHFNSGRGYAGFDAATPDGLLVDNPSGSVRFTLTALPDAGFGTPSRNFTLKFKAANLHNSPGKKYPFTDSAGNSRSAASPPWAIAVASADGDTLLISFSCAESTFDGISSSTVMTVSACSGLAPGSPAPMASASVESDFDLYEGENIFCLQREGDRWQLSGGNHGSVPVLDFSFAAPPAVSAGFGVFPGGKVLFSDISLSVLPDLSSETPDPRLSDPGFIASLSASADPVEGIWLLFDHSLEQSLLRLGGEYRLAVERRQDNSYTIFYLDGASFGSSPWRPGIVKGTLVPTPFPDIFNLTWRDALGHPMSVGLKAQHDSATSTLTLHFPAQTSQLRLRRLVP